LINSAVLACSCENQWRASRNRGSKGRRKSNKRG